MKRFFKILALTLLVVVLAAVIFVLVTFPPIMAGMAAKTMCSCVFVAGRTPESVREKELKVFPGLSSAKINIQEDSTVSATLLWKTSEAIFRKGLGCTLLSEATEEDVRNQEINLPSPPAVNQECVRNGYRVAFNKSWLVIDIRFLIKEFLELRKIELL